jgi:hypothetical protein
MIIAGNPQCECMKLLTESYRALLSVATKFSFSLVDQKHYPEPDFQSGLGNSTDVN